jgi:2-ketocyclohexanecarboxyl-CoA hydrolase
VGWNKDVGSIVLTGAGDKAFCTGGDQSDHEGGQYGDGERARHDRHAGRGAAQRSSATCPSPVIATRARLLRSAAATCWRLLCDMTIASENAIFGQVGPKMGSVDPGFGTAYLARVVGEKKAREIWYMCKRYTRAGGARHGPHATPSCRTPKLDAEVAAWCAELNKRSPTAIALAKKSFNADTESIRGMGGVAMQALRLYYNTEESQEGVKALNEKREPDFMKFYK